MSLMSAGARSFLHTTSALYDARRAAMRLSRAARALAGRPAPGDAEARASIEALREGSARRGPSPRRNILFVTVDQQRFDALGVNGGRVARTPVIDALARA